MVTPRTLVSLYLPLLVLERVLELVVSARNARRLRSRGAVEAGRGHYRTLVLFHVAFLVTLLVLSARDTGPGSVLTLAALAGALLAQALRWWAVATLGERWSTRVLVLPGARPVTEGPYRFLRHPNYLAVAMEMLFLPLALASPVAALVFSLGNAGLLAVRIRAEERALGEEWASAFRGKPRLFPRGAP
jgi:methyltransferase